MTARPIRSPCIARHMMRVLGGGVLLPWPQAVSVRLIELANRRRLKSCCWWWRCCCCCCNVRQLNNRAPLLIGLLPPYLAPDHHVNDALCRHLRFASLPAGAACRHWTVDEYMKPILRRIRSTVRTACIAGSAYSSVPTLH